jgi:hypothetical protein
MSNVPMPPNVAPAWLGLEHAREHAVVERGYRAGILALDRRKDLCHVVVRAHPDAADALIRVHDDERHLGDARCDVPVDVADRTTPVMDRLQRAIARDLHRRLCRCRSIDTTSYKQRIGCVPNR